MACNPRYGWCATLSGGLLASLRPAGLSTMLIVVFQEASGGAADDRQRSECNRGWLKGVCEYLFSNREARKMHWLVRLQTAVQCASGDGLGVRLQVVIEKESTVHYRGA